MQATGPRFRGDDSRRLRPASFSRPPRVAPRATRPSQRSVPNAAPAVHVVGEPRCAIGVGDARRAHRARAARPRRSWRSPGRSRRASDGGIACIVENPRHVPQRRRAPRSPPRTSRAWRAARPCLEMALQRAQHVEADDVARAFPDRVDRCLAVEARHRLLLDVAVAAHRLHAFERDHRGALAHPVLGGGHDAAARARVPRRGASIPHRRRAQARGAALLRLRARRRRARCASAARRRDACRTRRGASHQCIARASAARMMPALPITQSSRVSWTISRIVARPRPGSPSGHASASSNSTSADAFERLPSLSLSRSMRIALRVPSSSQRGISRHVSPSSRLREHEMRVALRRGEEPLVAAHRVVVAGARCRRAVRAHVRAPLPLGHAHADERGALRRDGQRPRVVVRPPSRA